MSRVLAGTTCCKDAGLYRSHLEGGLEDGPIILALTIHKQFISQRDKTPLVLFPRGFVSVLTHFVFFE